MHPEPRCPRIPPGPRSVAALLGAAWCVPGACVASGRREGCSKGAGRATQQVGLLILLCLLLSPETSHAPRHDQQPRMVSTSGTQAVWASPPDCVIVQLLRQALATQPRWPVVVGDLRLVCRGWRQAVDGHLPLLAPRAGTSAHTLTKALRRRQFPALRALRIKLDGESCCVLPLDHSVPDPRAPC